MSYLTVLAVAALITAAEAAEFEAFKAEVAAAPTDVRAFIERRMACDARLGGGETPPPPLVVEEGAPSAAPLTEAELNCKDLAEDEQNLRDRYEDRLRVLNLLDRAIETVW